MKYIKKPVVIEAVRWDGNKVSEVTDWISKALDDGIIIRYSDTVKINTLEGIMTANPGDYIIRGVNGELYPCKPDIFEKTYNILDSSGNMCFGDAIHEMIENEKPITRNNGRVISFDKKDNVIRNKIKYNGKEIDTHGHSVMFTKDDLQSKEWKIYE